MIKERLIKISEQIAEDFLKNNEEEHLEDIIVKTASDEHMNAEMVKRLVEMSNQSVFLKKFASAPFDQKEENTNFTLANPESTLEKWAGSDSVPEESKKVATEDNNSDYYAGWSDPNGIEKNASDASSQIMGFNEKLHHLEMLKKTADEMGQKSFRSYQSFNKNIDKITGYLNSPYSVGFDRFEYEVSKTAGESKDVRNVVRLIESRVTDTSSSEPFVKTASVSEDGREYLQSFKNALSDLIDNRYWSKEQEKLAQILNQIDLKEIYND